MRKLQTHGRFTFATGKNWKEGNVGKLSLSKMVCIIFWLCIAMAIAAPAQTFTSLVSFDYTDGATPIAGLEQGTDGNFYGTTDKGGTGTVNGCNKSCGTVFKITPGGTLTTLHSFDGTDGNGPAGILVLATNGNFYGTTSYGGTNDCTSYGSTGSCGTIFKMTAAGTLTTLYDFCAQANCTDGAIPWAGLVQGSDGNFYGTTSWGGTGVCDSSAGPGCGTVFKITPAGVLTTLHSFIGTDGAVPEGTLVQGTDGNLYGTATYGGDLSCNAPDGCGTVFKITPSGTLTTMHTFVGTDGALPFAGLVQASNGSFYGTTSALPLSGGGVSCTLTGIGYGTVFEITSAGTLTTLHSFDDTDGAYPFAGLVQATNGNFYGSTTCGGANGYGTLFELTGAGGLTTLHSFAGTDGALPVATLLQATSGTFYGSAVVGGNLTCDSPDGCGTVFSLSAGLSPFVETNPTSGKVGTKVTILGNNLTGSTAVSFNGTAATFKVVSGTEITTTVPTGATSGKVEVTTPKKTLKSNVVFRVP